MNGYKNNVLKISLDQNSKMIKLLMQKIKYLFKKLILLFMKKKIRVHKNPTSVVMIILIKYFKLENLIKLK